MAEKKINGLSKKEYMKRQHEKFLLKEEKKYGKTYKCYMPTRRWLI